ncbi:MAG: hypothetical protein KF724_10530 [Phycisphaeraceae bacterium]|nr:hypothetical protein [Phycisphaeraceae bacterium]
MDRPTIALPAAPCRAVEGASGGIILLTASVGSGHTRAAEAVAVALRESLEERGQSTPVRIVDLLDESPRIVSVVCRDAYLGLVRRAPRMLRWLYHRFDRPAASGLRGRLLWRALGRVRRLVDESRAETIVSTHFLASELVAAMRRGGATVALNTVVTDVDAHGMWIWPETDRYFVSGARAAATLASAGVPASRVIETGIPIDPAFERLPPAPWARRALGLDHDRPVILFSTGGAFVGPAERCVCALANINGPAQVIVICGHAAAVKRDLQAKAADWLLRPGVTLRFEGFTDRMHIWMAAADLFIGKPGGLSSAECRAAGLPMLITSVIPGQEEHNAAEMIACGAAQQIPSLDALTERVNRLLCGQATPSLVAMRAAARASSRAGAARRIAELVMHHRRRQWPALRRADAPATAPVRRHAG